MVSFFSVSARFCASVIIFLTISSALATLDSALFLSYIFFTNTPPPAPKMAAATGRIIYKASKATEFHLRFMLMCRSGAENTAAYRHSILLYKCIKPMSSVQKRVQHKNEIISGISVPQTAVTHFRYNKVSDSLQNIGGT